MAVADAGRWPGLDGLRGLAVAAVVVFHIAMGPAVNGFIGVDVFFALSGFLITSLLLREFDRSARISLRAFYVRRLRRLYPALVLLVVAVFGLAVITSNLGTVGPALVAALAYVANWWIYTGHPAPLLEHTWTLAIEEHFYLVWPVLLWGLLSRSRARQVVAAGVGLGLIALVAIPWSAAIDPVRISYVRGTPIIWGCLLAMLWWRRRAARRPSASVWAIVGWTALIVLTYIAFTPWGIPGLPLMGPFSVAGLLSVVIVAAIVLGEGGPSILRSAPMRWLGTRSYGIYLYHFPLLSLLRHHVPVGPLALRMVLGVALTGVIAELSYRWVEVPFLTRRSPSSPTPTA